jgi:heat shock protein HtpX
MAISRNIPADRGLTRRMVMTGFFIVLLYAAFIAILFALLHSLVLILVIGFGLLFCQYWFSAKIAMYAMHAKEVTPEQAPELHGVVDRLCALADMPKPKVAIATTDIPNAFATGRSPKSAVVCVTTGLLRRLDEPEVEAVLSHEISHVAHRDVAVMTIASGLGLIAGLLTRVMFYSQLFGGGRNNNQGGSQVAFIEMIILLVSVVVYFISFLLTMALSRYRELAADRSGAILIGRPSLLASALVKITGEMGRIPTKDLRAAEPFNAFFFTPAVSSGSQDQGGGGGFSFGNLFRTHPTLERRLAQLEQLEHQLGQTGSGTTV